MYEYDDEVLDTFLKKQTQLFSEEVADTPEAAEEFLEDCMAVVCKNIKEVRDYLMRQAQIFRACQMMSLWTRVRSLPLRMADSLLWKDSRYEVF